MTEVLTLSPSPCCLHELSYGLTVTVNKHITQISCISEKRETCWSAYDSYVCLSL